MVTITYALADKFSVFFDKIIGKVISQNGYIQVLEKPYDFFQYIFTGYDTNSDGVVDVLPEESGNMIKVRESGTWEALYELEINVPKTISVTNGIISAIYNARILDSYKIGVTNYYTIVSTLSEVGDYASKYTLTLSTENADGNFQGWYKNQDEEYILVSQKENPSFNVILKDNNNFIALYDTDKPVIDKSAITCIDYSCRNWIYDSGKQKIIIQTSCAVAENITVVSQGLVRTYNANCATEDLLVYDAEYDDIKVNYTTAYSHQHKQGSYTIDVNIGVESSNRFKNLYYRGFVRYETNGSDEVQIIYTNIEVLKALQ